MPANPLDGFKSSPATANDLRVNELPKLAGQVQQYGLKVGCQKFDEMMEQWRRQLERDINERLGPKDNTAVQKSGL